MDNRFGLIMLGVIVILFGFTFVFCLDAIAVPNVVYGVLAMIGFAICIGAALMNGMFMQKEGGALSLYYFSFVVIASIVYVWYLTRCGTAFGWW